MSTNKTDRTFEAVKRQVEAMGVKIFEVGLFKPGAQTEMIPRTWDKATLFKSIPWLRYQNSLGRNIYIRPKGEHPLTLLDDVNAATLARMKAEGFAPCVVVETSPGNFQAWLNHGRVLPKEQSTAAAKLLAAKFGADPSSADWRHFGRLADFTNRKERYQDEGGRFPFVLLVEAAGHVFSEAATLRLPVNQRAPAPVTVRSSSKHKLSIDDFRVKPAYGGDGHRIDLAYATYATRQGVSEAEIRTAILSRDLSKKGTPERQMQYADRTIKRAFTNRQR